MGGDPMLHARVFWGDTLLLARSFGAQKPVFSAHADFELLSFYGFAPEAGGTLVSTQGRSWSISPPTGVAAYQQKGQGWVPAAPSGGRELRLDAGSAVRLARGPFQLELSARTAPVAAHASGFKDMDWSALAFLILAAFGLMFFLNRLPPPPAHHPQEKEIVRQVQMRIEKKPEPPKEKKKPKPVEAEAPQEQKPVDTIQKATTLKAASAGLKSIDKITKATKGISSLLSSLQAVGKKGGSQSALPLMPSLGQAPAPVIGLGGTGPGGSIGPITKGSELLRGGTGLGVLGGATAGKGNVSGVPVSMPARAAKLQGSYDRDLLGKIINDHLNEIRSCYERALLRDPNVGAGKVQLEWTIGTDGSVNKVGTKVSTLKNSEVVSCLLDTIRDIKFPKPTGGEVIVSYPFLFNSVGY
jgi:outer membrane biosynthesis protein TonB